ncbi:MULTISPECIES: flagellar basal body-associated protein FliL [unclassified Fictibacillus]|uniref:flagellar basal body-associated protein FliL n=1 Tax=unclassified Fictibacillus TaxID=2644029 RepID=UPI00223E30C8|nr:MULTISPECIES: flagellar basal body-associated protein FliL [unclassified Fictibacillus]MED2973317.1 flagellar basal body-associated protein FliL [Fictibacillus sp. B-59209]UZJ77159.1 flagellar basal body-associated protein FliL [Fictibacillus sp. KU28468]
MEQEVKKSKGKPILIAMLAALVIMGGIGYYVFFQMPSKTAAVAEPSAEELDKVTVETEEITTNLADQSFIKIKFRIQADTEDAKAELEKRLFQVNNIIIYELSGMKAGDLQGQKGINHLEGTLKGKVSKLMQEGKIKRVYTIEKIIQ